MDDIATKDSIRKVGCRLCFPNRLVAISVIVTTCQIHNKE